MADDYINLSLASFERGIDEMREELEKCSKSMAHISDKLLIAERVMGICESIFRMNRLVELCNTPCYRYDPTRGNLLD